MKISYSFSSPIGLIIVRYLALKQALGREYTSERRLFELLDKFLHNKQSDLTKESFTAWCQTQLHLASGIRRNQMRNIRNLCLYRQRTEPFCFVPDSLQFPGLHQPVRPHIFTNAEIVKLFNSIKDLGPGTGSPLRQENYRLALVLLYTAGLRRRELVRLTIGDYNPSEHTLLIRESKFHKSRIIPLSYDGWTELEALVSIRRKRQLSTSAELPLLWNRHTKKGFYRGETISGTFHSLFYINNIRTMSGQLPRLHDIRHSFAVHALLRWYNENANVQAKLPMLSTYIGHISVVSTQYYLRFIDEVVSSASERFEKCCGALITESHHKRGLL